MFRSPEISPLDPDLGKALRACVDGLAKPPGSLGRVEEVAIRLGQIQGTAKPSVERAVLMVFAGDHGLTAEGVSAYPSAVTLAMVETFLAGRASANAFARSVGAEMRIVDAGIAKQLPPRPHFINAAVRRGTRNAAQEAALTPEETERALTTGIALAQEAAGQGFDVLALGEMGIGNTASASLILHRLTDIPLERCVGRGAGHDDAGLARKLAILQRAAARSTARDPFAVLSEFGGCEIVMMAGAVLGAASRRRAVLVDGFISTAAALAAIRLAPLAQEYCFFSHRSAETGHSLMLDALRAAPLLDLQMRLGEGTGALLALPILKAAARLLTDVISLEDVLKAAGP